MNEIETTEERYLHTMFDALRALDDDAYPDRSNSFAAVLLRGALHHAEYVPYMKYLERTANPLVYKKYD